MLERVGSVLAILSLLAVGVLGGSVATAGRPAGGSASVKWPPCRGIDLVRWHLSPSDPAVVDGVELSPGPSSLPAHTEVRVVLKDREGRAVSTGSVLLLRALPPWDSVMVNVGDVPASEVEIVEIILISQAFSGIGEK